MANQLPYRQHVWNGLDPLACLRCGMLGAEAPFACPGAQLDEANAPADDEWSDDPGEWPPEPVDDGAEVRPGVDEVRADHAFAAYRALRSPVVLIESRGRRETHPRPSIPAPVLIVDGRAVTSTDPAWYGALVECEAGR